MLRMDERSFWRCTPRKLMALRDTHFVVNGLKTKEDQPEPEVFIDQIPFL